MIGLELFLVSKHIHRDKTVLSIKRIHVETDSKENIFVGYRLGALCCCCCVYDEKSTYRR